MKPELLAEFQNLISKIPINYSESKIQSQKIDDMLGYRSKNTELDVLKSKDVSNLSKEFWIGLDVQALQTPYSEIVEIVNQLKPQPNQVWTDLGCAYGRVGIVLDALKTDCRFVGYEAILQRINEAKTVFDNLEIKNAKLICADITKIEINKSDMYFIYDFGSREDVCLVLEKLRKIASMKTIVVVARGRGIRNWIMMDYPWLSSVVEPIHFDHWSIFRSA